MTLHTPKGSMCIACIHRSSDCSHLPFQKMPKLEKSGNVIIVRCTEFVKEEKKGSTA